MYVPWSATALDDVLAIGEDAKEDRTQTGIVIKQVNTELEDLLRELKS